MYLIKTPFWLKAIYPKLLWNKERSEKTVYLTFDDGPTEEITKSVLSELKKHQAKASFFLIGKNAEAHPELVEKIKDEGHSIGNHTQNHLKGWKTSTTNYLKNIEECSSIFTSDLFRPPYGQIGFTQIPALKKRGYTIVMWDVLSGDFDPKIDGEQCYKNVVNNLENGSIIVFHDSVKAWPSLQKALPKVLLYLNEKGFVMKAL